MKSLDNINIKNIWHNAYIDLSEADHIVFIGYSFPDADFEMRCLLKKAVKSNVKVSVVLSSSDDPETMKTSLLSGGCSEDMAENAIMKMHLPRERYVAFFGEENVTFFYNGFRGYIDLMKA